VLYHDVTDYSTVYHLKVVPDKYSLQITTDFNKNSIITKQVLIRVSFLVTCSKGRYFQVDRYLRCSIEEKIVDVTFREPLFSGRGILERIEIYGNLGNFRLNGSLFGNFWKLSSKFLYHLSPLRNVWNFWLDGSTLGNTPVWGINV